METNWAASEDQKWFSYNYADGKTMVMPAELSLICCSASGVGV